MTARHHPSEPASPAGDDEIEFLAPRADLFGASDGFTTIAGDEPVIDAFSDVDDRPRSRAGTALAVLGLVGLIGIGIVVAAPWSNDADDAAPATTATPTTTKPSAAADPAGASDSADPESAITPAASSPDVDPEDADLSPNGPGFVVLRPPAGMVAAGAFDQGPERVPTAHLDIWATPGADRTTGTWVAVATTAYADGRSDLVADATVVDVGGVPALVTQDRDDVTVLTWRPEPGVRIAISSHGVALDHLLALAPTIALVDGETRYSAQLTTNEGVPLEHVLDEATATGDITAQVVQHADRIAAYEDTSGATSLVIGTRTVRDSDPTISRFLLATAQTSAGTAVAREVTVNGISVAVGSLPLSPRANIVQWRDGDDWITVIGTVPIDRLIRALRTGRMATDEEWDALIDLALDPDMTDESPAFVTIGNGSVGGIGWGAALSEEAGYLVLRSEEFYYSDNVAPDPAQPIRLYRSIAATYVVALVDDPSLTSLVVHTADGTTVDAELVPVPDGQWLGAAIAVEGGGEITTELVTAAA